MIKKAVLTVVVLVLVFGVLWKKFSLFSQKEKHPESEVEIFVEPAEKLLSKKVTQEEPQDLWILKQSYPDVQFFSEYEEDKKDWKISIRVQNRRAELYWCGGRLLPEDELSKKDKYWTLLYHYDREIKNPKDFTEEEIQRIKSFSSPENRTDGAGTPPFFYDVVYDCKTRLHVEEHIVKSTFLGKKTNCHEKLLEPLNRVEKRILEAADEDIEVRIFLKNLLSTDSYSWRQIRDSRNRSFHSVGIAIDVLPRGWGSKKIYWAWQRDLDPENWLLLPLERRWMPPQPVIDIFEDEGFIWGGKWIIWDNMHFEYHPEIILKNYGSLGEKGSDR